MSLSLDIAILGAGSSYTPVLLSEMDAVQAHAPLRVKLFDRDATRAREAAALASEIMPGASCAVHEAIGPALEGVAIVLHIYRAGPPDYRRRQELKARELNLVGQETQGFGGAASAMCNIAALRAISPHALQHCPDALHILITNPTGIMTAAASSLGLTAVGICELPYVFQRACDDVCGIGTQLDYIGLNHFAWVAGGRRSDGSDCTEELLSNGVEIAAASRPPNIPLSVPEQVIALFAAIPTPYLAYYYATHAVLAAQRTDTTRAEHVDRVNDAARAALLRGDLTEALRLAKGRGGHMLGETIVAFLLAWLGVSPRELILCKSSDRTDGIEVAAELPVHVSRGSLVPREPTVHPHAHITTMLATMRTYETLALNAALRDDFEMLEACLITHPLVRDARAARELRNFHRREAMG